MDADRALSRGLTLERSGRLAAAERLYRRVLLLAPESAAPREELARLLANRGRVREALEVLLAALRLPDRSPSAYLTAGRLLGRAGRWKEAEAALTRAAERADGEGQRVDALVALGELALATGRPPAAAESFERALALEPRCAAALQGLAAARPEGAAALLRRALELEPSRHEARAALCGALAAAGRGAEAAEECARLLAEAPASLAGDCVARLAEAGVDLARALSGGRGWGRAFAAQVGAGRLEEAFALGETAVAGFWRQAGPCEVAALLWPWAGAVRRSVAERAFCEERLAAVGAAAGPHARWRAYLRCLLLIALDRPEEALEGRASLSGAPQEYGWMRLGFGLAALSAGRPEEAERELAAALAGRPDLWWARCRLAESLLVRGRGAEARAELARACALAREAGDLASLREALTWSGEVLLWLGEYQAALSSLDEAAALGAETFTAGWRGAALLKLGRLPEALPELDRAVARDAKDAEALVWRAEARRLLGRPAEALADLNKALALSGGHLWARVQRALARRDLGEPAAAREELDRLPEREAAWVRRRGGPEAALAAARGIRRVERYLEPLWLEAA